MMQHPQTIAGAGGNIGATGGIDPRRNDLEPVTTAALVAGAGAVVGAGAGFWSDERNRDFNRIEAEKQRRWASNERDTAWQDTVNDLRAAGINPIHMFSKGGGATPVSGGSAASSSHASGPATMVAGANIAVSLAHAKLMNAQAAKTEAEIPAVQAGINETNARTVNAVRAFDKMSAEIDNIRADTETKTQVQREIQQRVKELEQLTRKYSSEANSAEAKARIDKEMADFMSDTGGDIQRWSDALGVKVRDLLHMAGGAGALGLFLKHIPASKKKKNNNTIDQNISPDFDWGGFNTR